MRAVILVAALLACTAFGLNYCGSSPVSYILNGPNSRAGFVWGTNEVTMTCGLATTSNAYSVGISVNSYCAFQDSQGEYAETILQQIPTNGYFSGSLAIVCPEGSRVMIAVSNTLATAQVPINVTYNFQATADGMMVPVQGLIKYLP